MAHILNLAVAPTAATFSAAAAAGKPATTKVSFLFGTTTSRTHRRMSKVVAMADMLGDFGGRDAYPEEIASNFAEKTLGNVDTLHRILIPTLSVLSLSRVPLDPEPSLLSEEDARRLLHKVVGWRLLFPSTHDNADDLLKLECVWKVKDQAAGEELVARIGRALEGAGGYVPQKLAFEAPNQVRAQLYSTSLGGLSVNDFIIAAKIDQIKTNDLIPKKRVEELILEDSRIDQYPKVVKGESKVVLEWQAGGSLSGKKKMRDSAGKTRSGSVGVIKLAEEICGSSSSITDKEQVSARKEGTNANFM